MKKALALLLLLLLVSLFIFNRFSSGKKTIQTQNITSGQEKSSNKIQQEQKKFVFVPYWTVSNDVIESDSVDSLIYFGITVNQSGIDTSEPGYQKMANFLKLSSNKKERILAIRMLDSTVNSEVVKNTNLQDTIIEQALATAKEFGFDGVLLDFETSAFGFDSTVKNISNFYARFAKEVKEEKLLFYISVFGDTYFRARAYDIKEISKGADKVIIMAYDFHKARSNPGPNFPFTQRDIYGYDFKKMIDEFKGDVSGEKLVVAFGYFGYDWKVDQDGTPTATGEPLSLLQAKGRFVDACEFKQCVVTKNASSESRVTYLDENEERHIVWFEDELSAQKKIDYLKSLGIVQTASWAYSFY